LKLLVVSQYFWPENFRINDLVQELVARGHDVTVLTGVPNYPDGEVLAEFKTSPADFSGYHGARVLRVPMIPRGRGGFELIFNYASFALSAAVIGPFKLRGVAFDRIFVFEPSPITVGIPAVVLRWLRKAPVAFWTLDLWPETLEAIGAVKSKVALGFVGRVVAFIYNRCDLILAQSRSFIPQIEKYCDDPRRIQYFASWAEAVHDAGDVAPAPEVSSRAGVFTVLFTGNVGEAQDFPAILDAADRLRNERVRWIVVGDGRFAPWVREEIARRNLQDAVLMLGRFPVERMPSFYSHADALLVSLRPDPIFAMTIPGKLQSYLAAGIPILAMLDGEGAQVVEQGAAGLTCAAGDAEGLAGAVLALAAMPEPERRAMGQRARALAAAEFDRTGQIDKLERLLTDLKLKGRR